MTAMVAIGGLGEVSTAISANEEELEKAKALRKTEAAQFQVTDAELTETVDTLVRAQSVLQKHQKQASMAEVPGGWRRRHRSVYTCRSRRKCLMSWCCSTSVGVSLL